MGDFPDRRGNRDRDERSLVTQGQFYGAIRELQERFDRIDRKLDRQSEQAQEISNRVLVVETERDGEKSQITKRGTMFGIVGGAALAAVWRIVEHVMYSGGKP